MLVGCVGDRMLHAPSGVRSNERTIKSTEYSVRRPVSKVVSRKAIWNHVFCTLNRNGLNSPHFALVMLFLPFWHAISSPSTLFILLAFPHPNDVLNLLTIECFRSRPGFTFVAILHIDRVIDSKVIQENRMGWVKSLVYQVAAVTCWNPETKFRSPMTLTSTLEQTTRRIVWMYLAPRRFWIRISSSSASTFARRFLGAMHLRL